MIIILDVSAAIEILLKKEKKEKFDQLYQAASWVIAPDLYVAEMSNVLWKYHRAKMFSHDDCIQYVEDGITMIDDFIEARQLWKEALGEGIKHHHAVYDMFYIVLARRHDATLVTNDSALSELCKKLNVACIF